MFDFDGTLADTFPVFLRLLGEISARYELRAIAESDVEPLRAMDTAGILAFMGVPRWKLPTIMAYARSRMADERADVVLFGGMPALLHALTDDGVHVAIVSSNSEVTVRAVLGDALSARVHSFACGTGLFGKARKVRRIVRATRVSGEQAVLVGDESRDILAAHSAGVQSIAVTWGYASAVALADADLLCHTVPELSHALGVTR
jgi:phosphoglycolate phosphatase